MITKMHISFCTLKKTWNTVQKKDQIYVKWRRTDWPQFLMQYHLSELHTLRCFPPRLVDISSVSTYQPRCPHAELYTLSTSTHMHTSQLPSAQSLSHIVACSLLWTVTDNWHGNVEYFIKCKSWLKKWPLFGVRSPNWAISTLFTVR